MAAVLSVLVDATSCDVDVTDAITRSATPGPGHGFILTGVAGGGGGSLFLAGAGIGVSAMAALSVEAFDGALADGVEESGGSQELAPPERMGLCKSSSVLAWIFRYLTPLDCRERRCCSVASKAFW